jgi:hypothetical protein
MGVPEPALQRGVYVFGGIGILVMPAVVAGPPDDPLLRRALSGDGEDELKEP